MRRTLVALAGITLLLGACSDSTPNGSASPTASASPAGVSIELTEFDFLMPDTIPAAFRRFTSKTSAACRTSWSSTTSRPARPTRISRRS